MKNLKFLFPLLVLFLLGGQMLYAQPVPVNSNLNLVGKPPVRMDITESPSSNLFTFHMEIDVIVAGGVYLLSINDGGENSEVCGPTFGDDNDCNIMWMYPRDCEEYEVRIECISIEGSPFADSQVVVIEPKDCKN